MTTLRTTLLICLTLLSLPLAAAEPERRDRLFVRHMAPHGASGTFAMSTLPLGSWGPGTMMASPALMGRLFPPTLIMQRQQELGLTEQQEETIKGELREFQSRIVDVQWDLQSNQGELESLLAADRIDADAATAAIDKVLNAENTLKKLHLAMLIRIRNVLNPEQIDKLDAPFAGLRHDLLAPRPEAPPAP